MLFVALINLSYNSSKFKKGLNVNSIKLTAIIIVSTKKYEFLINLVGEYAKILKHDSVTKQIVVKSSKFDIKLF